MLLSRTEVWFLSDKVKDGQGILDILNSVLIQDCLLETYTGDSTRRRVWKKMLRAGSVIKCGMQSA